MDEGTRKILIASATFGLVEAVKELDRKNAEIDALHAEIGHLKAMAGEKE